ncbi:DoxX family protein [Salinibacter altiplanensis]|uniref:DoxX family protein n=1 Tax=Salinibacter altiplanensis TaxID=1803181 RepID=UPI000C9F18F8|nr:DoxX family protein [Salinibacter altiplanensis]
MRTKYLYWGSTSLVALFMMVSATLYFVADGPAAAFKRLGFPDYFRIELGIAKLAGAVVLVAPLPRALKEWAYAGFAISFVSAVIAHAAVGDPPSELLPPGIAFALLMTSYVTYHRYYRPESPSDDA